MYTQFIDYALFFAFLIGSTLYPLWGGLRRNNKDTKANYVFAAGQVSVFAMMLSIARGTLGVRAFLGKYDFSIYIFIPFISLRVIITIRLLRKATIQHSSLITVPICLIDTHISTRI